MFIFDPVNIDVLYTKPPEDIINDAVITFQFGTDLSIDMGEADNNQGTIDQGYVIDGTISGS